MVWSALAFLPDEQEAALDKNYSNFLHGQLLKTLIHVNEIHDRW